MSCRPQSRTTPEAIAFPPERGPAVHVPDFRYYTEATNRVLCLRCGRMIDSSAWAKPCLDPGPSSPDAAGTTIAGEPLAR